MIEYSKINVKLADTQLKKLKIAVKDNTGATLRMSLRMTNENNLPHELLLTERQKTKLKILLIIICQLIYSFLKLKFQK